MATLIEITKKIIVSTFFFLFITSTSLFAQSNNIKGKVHDSNNEPLIGVTVTLYGASKGTITDVNGDYSITVESNSVLIFSYMGYKTQKITVGNRKNIDIILEESAIALDQVVVIGYGTMKRRDLTGAISSIDATQIQKTHATNLGQALQGRMSGVQVSNIDGTPGAGVNVLIRGVGSFGDNSPLYVIDGYPGTGMSGINPEDIESIDILKDASAAAIYGSRAANGVVIVTTKRGSKDGIKISVDATTSFQLKPNKLDVLNAQEFATLAVEVADLQSSPVLDAWRNPSSLNTIDWQDVMFKSGLKQNYNISIRGGSDKSQSSVSFGFTDQDGVVLFSSYKRYNAALTQDYTPYRWIKSSTNARVYYTDTNVGFGSGQGGVGRLSKIIPTMTGNPLTDQVEDANGNYGFFDQNANAVRDSENVYATAKKNDKKSISNGLNASTSLEIIPFDGLTIKTNFGVNFGNSWGYNFVPYNDVLSAPRDASYSQNAYNSVEWLWENTINYSKKIGLHSFDAMVGVSAQKNTTYNSSASGSGLASDGLRSIAALTIYTATGYHQTWSLASEFGRFTYKFGDKYIFTGTIRRDGSSKFATGYKYGIFPSVSGAWRIKEESFLKDVEAISNLKLRASYGEAGNQNIGLFQYQSSYSTGLRKYGYVFGQNKVYIDGMAQSFLPNPTLKWETSIQTDFGVDLGLFNNKLTITADYFEKKSKDFLLNIQMPAQTGYTQATRNVGSVKNTGCEVMLTYRNNDNKFKYGANLNITTVKNKIESLAAGKEEVANLQSLDFSTTGNATWAVFSMSRVGGSIGDFYGYETNGIIQTQDEIDALNANARQVSGIADLWYIASGTAPGDRKFVDQNADGIITDADRVVIGSPLPKFYGGINLNGEYNNFDFNLFFNYSYGNQILNFMKRNLVSMGGSGSVGLENVSKEYYTNRWTESNKSNEYPRAVWSDVNGNSRVSDAFVEDGSYIRLKNVEVGYTITSKNIQKMLGAKLRIFMSVQNLFTITGYSGLDPEIGGSTSRTGTIGGVTASGVDVGIYPYSQSFALGLNLKF